MGSFKPITAPYFPLLIKPQNFAKRQCKLQWLTPPKDTPVHDRPGNRAVDWYRRKITYVLYRVPVHTFTKFVVHSAEPGTHFYHFYHG